MNLTELRAKVLPSLTTGTSRLALPADLIRPADPASDGVLALLSLVGQALRFERPSTPEAFSVEPEIRDERKIIADALRRPLVRLLGAKSATEHPARALARIFDRMRLRPHPFDLPLIDAFVRCNAEKLGPTAQHWADRQKPQDTTRSYFDPEALDDSNWTQVALRRRIAYLEQRRRDDADGARALVESNWAKEDAEARFRLLEVFETRLSLADQSFLSSLEKDRAPRVRATTAKFLARLGAGGENPALRACLERIKQGKSGLLRKRVALELELPTNVKDQAASRWVRQTFADVSLAELAGAFKITERELTEAAGKDEPLLLALALMATTERRLDLLELAVEQLPNAWEKMAESGLDTLGTMTESERQRWTETIAHPYGKGLPAVYSLWDWLHRITDAAAPFAVMSVLLKANFFAKLHEHERSGGPWFEVMAAICPPPQRQELREQIVQFDPSQTVGPLLLLDILDRMERDLAHV